MASMSKSFLWLQDYGGYYIYCNNYVARPTNIIVHIIYIIMLSSTESQQVHLYASHRPSDFGSSKSRKLFTQNLSRKPKRTHINSIFCYCRRRRRHLLRIWPKKTLNTELGNGNESFAIAWRLCTYGRHFSKLKSWIGSSYSWSLTVVRLTVRKWTKRHTTD